MMLCVLGLEYNKEFMDKAAAIYSGWASFLTKAESYVQGHLQSKPIEEHVVLERWDAPQIQT